MQTLQTILTGLLGLAALVTAVVITMLAVKHYGRDKDKVVSKVGKASLVILFDAAVVTGINWTLAKSVQTGWGIPGF